MQKLLFISILLIFLTACNSNNSDDISTRKETEKNNSTENIVKEKNNSIEDIVKEGDFIFTLNSSKNNYQKDEKIDIEAQIVYQGEQEKVKIKHSQSPLSYNLINVAENKKLLSFNPLDEANNSTLLKGKPLKIKTMNFDTTEILDENGQYKIEAKVNFSFEDKIYEMKNNITFSIQ